MGDPIPTVVRRDSSISEAAKPLLESAQVLKARVVEDLQDAHDQIEQLHREAEQLVEEAEQQADQIREQAREEGRKEAMQECMENLAMARDEYTKLKQRAEQDMVTLAFRIARRIIGHAIELEPKIVTNIVGEALVNARGREQIVVHVHPKDYQQVQESRHEYAQAVDGVAVYFEPDDELQRGDCIIETESGRIDARLDTQLEVMEEALLDV